MAVKSEVKCWVSRRKTAKPIVACIKEERSASYKKVASILQKTENLRTKEEKDILCSCPDLVKEITRRIERRQKLKERLQEVEDPPEVLLEKCHSLAAALRNSAHLVVYTGAGISTAACIPDYRGSNGIWTLLQQGKDIGLHDLTQAEPTVTHMALYEMHRVGLLKYVVSQNCDGLHLRSGLPRQALSEVHGNMYLEVCQKCKPPREYWRLFDVTENTARFNHRTMRRCYLCLSPLIDTIVHFGERGKLKWPLNWPGACQAADKADVILCMGSSLKVLKKYPWLWGMDRPMKRRPKLYIVNLQWTPKDDQAILKISGKCDDVMIRVMNALQLSIPVYDRQKDPIFNHCTDLHAAEQHTTSKPFLKYPCVTKNSNSDNESFIDSKEFGVKRVDSDDSEMWRTVNFVPFLTDCSKVVEGITIDVQSIKTSVLYYSSENEQKSENCKIICKEEYFENEVNPPMEIIYEGVKLLMESDYMNISDKIGVNMDVKPNICTGTNSKPFERKSTAGIKVEENSSSRDFSCNSEILDPDFKSFVGFKKEHMGNTSQKKSIQCKTINGLNDSYFEMDSNFSSGNNSCTTEHSLPIPCHLNTLIPPAKKQTELSNTLGLPKYNISNKVQSTNKSTPSKYMKQKSTKKCLLQSSFQGCKKGDKIKQDCDATKKLKYFTMCSFCKINYNSNICRFYPSYKPNFKILNKNKNSVINKDNAICECCGDSSEDTDEVTEIGKSKENSSDETGKKIESEDDNSAKSETRITNPGWYGKGYRKRVKKKR